MSRKCRAELSINYAESRKQSRMTWDACNKKVYAKKSKQEKESKRFFLDGKVHRFTKVTNDRNMEIFPIHSRRIPFPSEF